MAMVFCYEESVEELKEKIVYLTYELQSARMEAEEEGRKRKEVVQLLEAAYKERDEAREKLNESSSSLSGESSSLVSPITYDPETQIIYNIAKGRPLPEKGNLLAAVSRVGPLLHSLMVPGPLPRWRNPPPLLQLQVPPVAIAGSHERSFNTMLPTPKRHRIQLDSEIRGTEMC